jgi:NAD(P)H-dependent FMN reductase
MCGHSDPDVLDLPLLKKPLHFYQDQSEAPLVMQETNKLIANADSMVIVTAEYNHCMPPALTNMIDHFPLSSYKYVPSAIMSYSMGSFGGARATVQARTMLGELGSPNISSILSVPTINKALTEDGHPTPGNERLDASAEKLIKELEWYANALKNHKAAVGKPNM